MRFEIRLKIKQELRLFKIIEHYGLFIQYHSKEHKTYIYEQNLPFAKCLGTLEEWKQILKAKKLSKGV